MKYQVYFLPQRRSQLFAEHGCKRRTKRLRYAREVSAGEDRRKRGRENGPKIAEEILKKKKKKRIN